MRKITLLTAVAIKAKRAQIYLKAFYLGGNLLFCQFLLGFLDEKFNLKL